MNDLHRNYMEAVRSGEVLVTFLKANNEVRTMHCQQNSEETGLPPTNANPNMLVVWEIGVGWRAFKTDRVISLEVLT